MKYYLLLLLLVAAGYPQLMVEISTSPAEIKGVEYVSGAEIIGTGSWALRVIDEDEMTLYETPFEPYMLDLDGNKELLSEVYVGVQTASPAKKVQLIDNQGNIQDTFELSQYCGNYACEPGEENYCEEDCPIYEEEEQAIAALEVMPVQEGFPLWKSLTIAACVLLIIVLVLVMVHVNRKKENPVMLSKDEQWN